MVLRWPFDQDNDRSVLAEWTDLLKHVSNTLIDLKWRIASSYLRISLAKIRL